MLKVSASQWLPLKGGAWVVFLLSSSLSDILTGPSPCPSHWRGRSLGGGGQGVEITVYFLSSLLPKEGREKKFG